MWWPSPSFTGHFGQVKKAKTFGIRTGIVQYNQLARHVWLSLHFAKHRDEIFRESLLIGAYWLCGGLFFCKRRS